MNTDEMRTRLGTLLEGMSVPAMRRDLTQTQNIGWLKRNLPINNADNENIVEAMVLVTKLLSV